MSALKLHVTAAGIAAIINAENTGTAPVLISHVGLTDQVFSAPGATTLPGELKRLTTFGGAAVANDTIHITIRDDSSDSYTLRGFGLYLGDGTLFAVYSHAGETQDYIMQKASAAMLLLQSDVRFTQINAANITFGSAEWLNPPATTTVAGVVELADSTESIAGADPTRAVTPAGMKAALDGRFGEGAPSGFVKGLLALATAAAIRAAIGLGAAALRDEGHGKGLDADKLDGQEGSWYRDWANLTGKPAMFTPTAHAHQWSDILNPPASATRWPSWLEVTDRPTTFPPSPHTHAAADVTSGTFDAARIPALPVSQITNLQQLLDAKARINNPQFTGSATFQGVLNAMSGNIGISALAETNSTYWLRDEAGRLRGALQWDRATDTIRLIRHNDAGNDIVTTLALPPNGNAEWNGRALWHTGNFDPNTKAPLSNPQFTGTGIKIGAGQSGECNVAFGVDDWYLYSNSGNFGMFSGSKGTGFAFDKTTKTLSVNGNNVWTSGNFNPNTKASLGANVGFADVTAHRGNGTGVIFLNGGDRYLHWDGGRYVMPGGALNVGGGFDFGSSRKLKNVDGPMPYGLAEVRQIATLIGRYKPEYVDDGRQRLFFDAEQFMEIMPEAVNAHGVEFNGEDVPTIKLDQVMPPAYRAIAQLADLVDELRAEITAMKAAR